MIIKLRVLCSFVSIVFLENKEGLCSLDFIGPSKESSIGGSKYLLTIIDD